MSAGTAPTWFEYVVDVTPSGFGRLASIDAAAPCPSFAGVEGKRCWEVVQGRADACPNCPALRAEARGTVQREVERDGDGYMLVEAEPQKLGLVHVRRARIGLDAMRALTREHLHETARLAGLSARELDVLDYLARGVDSATIAKRLGVQPRTVKFHQTNLLRKLGLSSRADLIRLLT